VRARSPFTRWSSVRAAGMGTAFAIGATGLACSSSSHGEHDRNHAPAASASAPADPLAPLHAYEEARRAATDFARAPASDHLFGPDPYAIRRLPGASPRYAAILRGRDALVLLDGAFRELFRAPAPPSPSGLAVAPGGEILVSGELSKIVLRYRVQGDAFVPSGSVTLDGALAVRAIALGGDAKVLYAVEEHDGRLLAVPLGGAAPRREIRAGHGAFRVAKVGKRVLVGCLLDHTVTVYPLDAADLPLAEGAITIRHDGPIWGFDAVETAEGLFILAGGVEDHPLDRSDGSFGYIDSFVFLYRIANGAKEASLLASINASSEGVVTPKALVLRGGAGGLSASVAGAGAAKLLDLFFPRGSPDKPVLHTRALPPGASMLASDPDESLVFADPLLDGFGRIGAGKDVADALVPAGASGGPAEARAAASRVGEALFFTNLMAPWNSSAGAQSRFTCETCHFEGYVDGRTHSTGRGDIHATTKPLLGLFNNRPHFSRAFDPNLTSVVHNEFRVASALSGHDPWFSAPVAELSWVASLSAGEDDLTPEGLRKSLMVFLMEQSHRPNPAPLGRGSFSPEEFAGAVVFERRCERCHSARLVSDVASSRVPLAYWEPLVFAREGAIVWGRSGYEKTGVVPYVTESGARVPSLRRLYKKRPYFTNGAAKELSAVLDGARFGATDDAIFYHAGAPADAALVALTGEEKTALLAFLDLL
jgi:hypothetical protein